MMQEIVFTSARRGLRSGSTGFCTVRSTRGMPGNLAQLLERLTGYAHVFDAYGTDANWNPVNYAHYVARLGGQRFHILARISNAPMDHTNRSNKLAHLLTADSAALAVELSEGPASESLQIPWVTVWSSDSEPTVLSDDQQLVLPIAAQVRTGVCEAWKEATGDAGWAAVLASYAADSQTTLQIILPRDVGTRSEQWTLRLVNEALSLLPPESRWDVSYSTFFTGNLPVSISCQWQFVLDGTDLAKKARLDPRSRTIDLPAIKERKLPAAKNELTVFAQTGSRPWSQEAEAVLIARRRKRELERTPFGPTATDRDAEHDIYAEVYVEPETDAAANSGHGRITSDNFPPSWSLESRKPAVRPKGPPLRKKPVPLLLRPVSLLLIGVLGIFVALAAFSAMHRPKSDDKAAQVISAAKEKAERRRKDKEERDARRREAEEERAAEELRRREENAVVNVAPKTDTPREMVSPDVENVSPQLSPSAEISAPRAPQLSPLQEIRDKGRKLELRLPSTELQATKDGPIRLAKIHVNSLDHVSLNRIIGGQSVLKSGYDYAIVSLPSANQPFRKWEVIRQPTAGGGLDGKKDIVGTFHLNQKFELSFSWDRSNKSHEMINCLLEIEAGDPDQKPEKVKCVLREVEHRSPLHFDITKAERSERLVSRSSITEMKALELHCAYANLPEVVTLPMTDVMKVGDSLKFIVQPPTTGKYARKVTMIVHFDETEQDAQVRMEAVVEIPVVNKLSGEVTLETFDWKPGLSARVDEEIEAYGNRVNNMREELMEKEKAAESGRSERDEKKQKMIDAAVNAFRDVVNQNSNLHAELKSHSADLKKLMADIAQHGQLKCSLRLKVPDAEPGGIELLVTDGPDATQNE
jgi:hypothetical protein